MPPTHGNAPAPARRPSKRTAGRPGLGLALLASLGLVLVAAGGVALWRWSGDASSALSYPVFVIFASVLIGGLLNALLRYPRKAWAFLSSADLAAALLLLFAALTALGTLFAPAKGAASIPLWSWLGGRDLFHSAPYEVLLGGIAVSSASTVLLRKPWRRWRTLGFLFLHLGLVVLLVGALVDTLRAVRGSLTLTRGQPSGVVMTGVASQDPHRTQGAFRLPFSVVLDRFVVEEASAKPILRVLERAEKGGIFKQAGMIEARPEASVELEGRGVSVVVQEVYPHHRMAERVEATASGEKGVPAAKLRVIVRDRSTERWITGATHTERTRRFMRGRLVVQVDDAPLQEDLRKQFESSSKGLSGPVLVLPEGKVEAIHEGSSLDLGSSGRIEVVRLYRRYRFHLATRTARDAKNGPLNPAVELRYLPANGAPPTTSVLFADTMGRHGAAPPIDLRFEDRGGGAAGEALVWIDTRAGVVTVVHQGTVRDHHISEEPSLELRLAGQKARIEVLAVLPSARTVRESIRSENPKDPAAVRVKLREPYASEERTYVLEEGGRDHLPVGHGRFLLIFRMERGAPRGFASHVRILGPDGGVLRSGEISVNRPMSIAGFTLFQHGYTRGRLDASEILVVRQPGAPLLRWGLFLIVAGTLHLALLRRRPRWLRRLLRRGAGSAAGEPPPTPEGT